MFGRATIRLGIGPHSSCIVHLTDVQSMLTVVVLYTWQAFSLCSTVDRRLVYVHHLTGVQFMLTVVVNCQMLLLCDDLMSICVCSMLLHFTWRIAKTKCMVATAVCVSVYRRNPTLLHRTGCNLGNGRVPLVVHYWADLQSVHGFRCYDDIHVCKLIALFTANVYSTDCEMSASACTHSMAGYVIVIK